MRNHFHENALLDGRYRTVSPLNHGSFGLVFIAKDTWTQELVALKCLTKPSAATDYTCTVAIDDRSEELAIHRRIGRHPNIVNLTHHFETEHHIYLVLEYCPNGDLYEAIRLGKGPLQTEHVRAFMLQLVDAVEFMHAKGLYHRDIKPENIFLTSSGSMKLGDFGLATAEEWTFEAAVGSDRYMAPEQFNPADTGYSPAKADIWAIGICLLNILFSRNPFATPTGSDPLFADFAADRQTLFDVFPNMSQDTFEVLIHCLAIDPASRNLANVKNALRRVISFTIDDEPLDEFCTDNRSVVPASANREPLRTPSISTPQVDDSGAFQWAKALAMSPPQQIRQLSAIPDTEVYSQDLFPSSEKSDRTWFSIKPDNASVASFVDSGLGVSLNSTDSTQPEPVKVNRSKPVPISGSLPNTAGRPIPSMSGWGKKSQTMAKSWSDLWDEEEEEQVENMFRSGGAFKDKDWGYESGSGRDTPRAGLAELKNPESVNNSRVPPAEPLSPFVSEQTGFIFEDGHSTTTSVPRYSPPSKRSIMDKWATLGEIRRGNLTPKKVSSPPPSAPQPPRKRSRAASWRRNFGWGPSPQQDTPRQQHQQQHHGKQSHYHYSSHTNDHGVMGRKEWNLSKDWRRHDAIAISNGTDDHGVSEIEWVWRNDLHL